MKSSELKENQEHIENNFRQNTPSQEEIINQALKFHSTGNLSKAALYYQEFIDHGFEDQRVFSNFGLILQGFGKLKEAEKYVRKAIAINPYFVGAYLNLGLILRDLGNLNEAEKSTSQAIKINPKSARAHSNLGIILKDLGKLNEADSSLRKAIEIDPDYVNAYLNLGIVLKDLGKLKEAEKFTRKAIEIKPNFANSHFNLGGILRVIGELQEAEKITRKSIELNPEYASAYSNLGDILNDLGKYPDAINNYHKAIDLDENLSVAKSGLIKTKGMICDWRNQQTEKKWLETIGIEGASVNPLGLFYYQDNPLKQLLRAKNLYLKKYRKQSKDIPYSENKKIRIGYFSSDFRAHPVMYLISKIFKLHDKSRFKIYLYSFAARQDKYTEIAKNSGCIFKDIKDLTDLETVKLVRKDKVNIAIDLMGYTKNNRMNIFSYRVAPIQINYLGYPGSVGSDTVNYIIADQVTIPNHYQNFYSEKIIRMPNCFLCNDDTKEICKEPISRKDFNLPEKAFVFTCFCANRKITPREFDIWMRLLTKIKGSVIWLFKSNKFSVHNLKREAEKRNVDPKRLIFASKLPLLKKHLARYSLGDLGLDTFNYNGHTTTSDALWSGLPVLTKMGKGFASRVSASLLTSIGLTELITRSEKEYEEMAFNLAQNPKKLAKLKTKLAELREQSPLYNSELFTRDLENKLTDLFESSKKDLNK